MCGIQVAIAFSGQVQLVYRPHLPWNNYQEGSIIRRAFALGSKKLSLTCWKHISLFHQCLLCHRAHRRQLWIRRSSGILPWQKHWRELSLPLFYPAQTEKIWQALWVFRKQKRATMQNVSQQFSWGNAASFISVRGSKQANFCKVYKLVGGSSPCHCSVQSR